MSGVEIPAELVEKIAEAVEWADAVIAGTEVLGRLSRQIDEAIVDLHHQRGGDDEAFDQLCAVTDHLNRLEQQIADRLVGWDPR